MAAIPWKWGLWAVCVAIFLGFILLPPFSGVGTFPRDNANKLQKAEIRFQNLFLGPESLAFDLQGNGPYTGISDGRIIRWNGPEDGWTDFAFTSPNRSNVCNTKGPLVPNFQNEHICGRPVGLRFHPDTGDLYIADAYFGLRVVGHAGGFAKPVVIEVDGMPLTFTNDVDFDADGQIYFTDSSSKHPRREFALIFLGGDDTGRLLCHNPESNVTKVLVGGLQFANGIAVSKDKSFILVSETLRCRIMRYWLKGPKASTFELFASLPGYPDNIRLTERGDFWVAIHARPNIVLRLPVSIRRALLKSKLPFLSWYINFARKLANGMAIRLSPEAKILEVLEDADGKVVKLVSEVVEKDGKLWFGSPILPQIAVY